ncbi:hypothetical protein [Curtobacterium sp. MCBD17_003]|uniref:hypothetical protein n=1 Tax=Curtobacterium sp. MCBD17_003 TaxID=2175667 RepID=UPI0024DF595F|nr:hypothetical protein [Curtobacterium sp. MCBD17_003]WIE54115.1 hypothetical protein DEI88_013455 [Curtobacterium sp. MCBD17_003]
MVDPRTNLIPGPTARWLLFARVWMFGIFFVDMLTMLAFAIFDFSALRNPAWYVIMFPLIVAFAISNVYYAVVKKRELAQGYTTLPMDFPNTEVRDPATGNVLNAAGQPLPDDFSLKRARAEYARSQGV